MQTASPGTSVESADFLDETCPSLDFNKVVSRHYDRLFHRVLRLVGNADGAREVVQETFLRALQFRHSFNGHARYSTWLYRIAVNTVITAKRKQSRERRLDIYAGEGYRLDIPDASGALQPSHALERAEEKRRLHAALKQLSIEHSMVLVMKDMEGWSYEEISKALDLPIGTIRSRLSRARLKLRKLLIEERPK